jgi:hypothetical protein
LLAFKEILSGTVEPGLPEPEPRLRATCPKLQEDAAKLRRMRNVQAGRKASLSMFNIPGTVIPVLLVLTDYTIAKFSIPLRR